MGFIVLPLLGVSWAWLGFRAWKRRQGGGDVALLGLAHIVAPFFCMMASPILFFQGVALLGIACLASWRSWAAATQWKWATGTALLICTVFLVPDLNRTWTLRRAFPLESMEARFAATGLGEAKSTPMVDSLEAKLDEFEHGDGWWVSTRSRSLQILHAHAVETFLSQPGFGVMRGPQRWFSESELSEKLRSDQPLKQNSLLLLASSLGELEKEAPPERFDKAHAANVFDFVHPNGWGYVRDRQHVAGFQSHRFLKEPESSRYRVKRLDLVGVVVHERPVAYVTDDLPQMDLLRKAPTRELDAFESAGLDAMRHGTDLFARKQGDRVRVLGSIRAAKQCTTCHGCERGALLGAFSYLLEP
jgi:hypothetical protein